MEEYLEIIPTCVSCDVCRLICPENAIFLFEHQYAIENWSCTLCNICVLVCPVDAIKIKSRPLME